MIILCLCMILLSCTPTESTRSQASITPQKAAHSFFKKAMGTDFTMTIITHDQVQAQMIARIAFKELQRIESRVSSWIPSSEVSEINRWAGKKSVVISEETYRLLAESIRISQRSEGAFDITWASLKGLWDFRQQTIPTHPQIKIALQAVGFQKLKLTPPPIATDRYLSLSHLQTLTCGKKSLINTPRVEFVNPLAAAQKKNSCFSAQLLHAESRIDLGGIAKGYAIDVLAHILKKFKYQDFLIDGGGDLYAEGTQAHGEAWRVGIQHPRSKHLWTSFKIPSGHAIVSSGDYERFFIKNQQRYHHIIDLRTGYPAQASIAATVIANSAVEADAWATALFILGKKRGLNILNQQKNIEGLVFTPHGQVESSTLFKNYFPSHPNSWKR